MSAQLVIIDRPPRTISQFGNMITFVHKCTPMSNHFQSLLDSADKAPEIYQATSYWKNYERRILKDTANVDFSDFRSGKYPIYETFGFAERKFQPVRGWKEKLRIAGSALKRVFLDGKTIMPYDLDIRDIQVMAYHHAELLSQLSGTPGPENYSISNFGNPEDQFTIGSNLYNTLSLSYYIRLCFLNKHLTLNGNEVIIELGSGSCHQIEVIKKLYPNITILCFDLPGPLYLGERFMRGVFGSDQIVSSSECMGWQDLSKVQKGKIHFFGNWQCELVQGFNYDIFWNAASFGEMEPKVVQHYLNIFSPGAKSIFLLQASKGKERHRVKDPILFENYDEWVPGFQRIAIEKSYKIHKPMTASGGYLQVVYKKKQQ
jgi:putative sugar O-methyltransferase